MSQKGFQGGYGLAVMGCLVIALQAGALAAATVDVRSERSLQPATSAMAAPIFQIRIQLEPLPSQPEESRDSAAKGRLQIGMRRDFRRAEVVDHRYVKSRDWTTLPDGSRLWAASIIAEGARGLRVHVRDLSLPEGVTLLVYSPALKTFAGVVDFSQAAGAKDLWMPTVLSESLIFECRVPRGIPLEEVAFTLDGVSHLYDSPAPSLAKAGSCNNDVACEPAWQSAAAGVGRITLVDNGNTYVCSGALLANNSSDAAAYFLTANHCVDSQAVAATLEFYWHYQTTACGGSVPPLSEAPRTTGGADLVAGAGANDFSLLRLRRGPPSGVFYLAWSPQPPSVGEPVTTIHHPGGAYKRISFGAIVGATSGFDRVKWLSGVTEPGSSGAPLFNSRHEIVGQLYGGTSSCSNPSGIDSFGKFALTYQAVKTWLEPGTSPAPAPPLIVPRGTYSGLFEKAGGFSSGTSGLLILTSAGNNRFTGSIRMISGVHPFVGLFNNAGEVSVVVKRGVWPSLTLALQVDRSNPDQISGSIGDATWSSAIQVNKAAFNGTTQIAPQAGRYTLVFPGAGPGDGIAVCTITRAGVVQIVGKMPPGFAWSRAGYLSGEGEFPVYTIGAGGQTVCGWAQFGAGYWSSPGGSIAWVREHSSTRISVGGSRYVPPPASQPVLGSSSVAVILSGEALEATFALPIGPKRTLNGSNDKSQRIFVAFGANGAFSGNVLGTGLARLVPFRGVVLQNSSTGYGYFAAGADGGSVRIESQ